MKFRCVQPIEFGLKADDVKRYMPGDEIDLGKEHAKPLLDIGHIAPLGQKAEKTDNGGGQGGAGGGQG
jgi:hypothetical protein